MTEIVWSQQEVTAKYVHATSRGHEAVQIYSWLAIVAAGLPERLLPRWQRSTFNRNDSVWAHAKLQLAKRNDPFSGGRLLFASEPQNAIICQKSLTKAVPGMQTIPATGMWDYSILKNRQGSAPDGPANYGLLIGWRQLHQKVKFGNPKMRHKQLPVLYFIQDNEWDIGANAREITAGHVRLWRGLMVLKPKVLMHGTGFYFGSDLRLNHSYWYYT